MSSSCGPCPPPPPHTHTQLQDFYHLRQDESDLQEMQVCVRVCRGV